MEHNFQHITVQQLCEVIDLIYPCMDDYLYVFDLVNDFYYIAPTAVQRFRISSNSFHDVADNLNFFVYPPDFPALQEDINQLLDGTKDFHNMEYRWIDTDGNPVWINCKGFVVKDGSQPLYMIGCINEIGTQQKADNISGLLSESSLQKYLQSFYPFFPTGYLLRLGIDDFKGINEKMGTEYGDMILRKTADCISSCILPGQQLYRLVADEFMILDFLGDGLEHAVNLYKHIRIMIDRFVEENQYEVVFTISAGILESSKLEDFSFPDTMRLSEFALNEAKRRGRNQYYTFLQEDYDAFLRKKNLSGLLRQAARNNFAGFEAYFQPLFTANGHKLYGAETLMRFRPNTKDAVSPAEFIPVLEETGLIIPLGRWILHQALNACRQIIRWVPDFQITINVSSIQILKSSIIDDIISAVKEYDVPPSNVVIELTESGILESDIHFSKLWERLKDIGIRLALDDFGTGYSNFHYLYDLKPDIIKIDRSFVAKALSNEYEYNLLSLMSDLIHNLNLKMCVEGIETQAEELKMQSLSPDYSQGFYYGKPCPYKQFIEQFVKP
ncbi:MAG: GGDEF and EAL domain-containing protein [Bacteroidales bacterium]|nr:GGDEF and EAL domain-containing protein [Clostridium sp.]MCM1204117.1 GGDEF and EAL domain-containing protein [Bacteroidales bacterium]